MKPLLYFFLLLVITATIYAQDKLTLDDAIRLGLKNNYDVQIARNDADISKVNNSWATSGAYPTAVAGITGNTSAVSIEQKFSNGNEVSTSGVTQSSMQAFATINWKVFDGMKMFATKSKLEELERSSNISLQQRISQTIFDISLSYYGLVRLHQQLKATQELITVLEERERIAQTRFNVGVAAKNDLLQAQMDLNEQHSALYNVANAIAQLEVTLNTLIGRIPTQRLDVDDSIMVDLNLDLNSITSTATEQNYSTLLAKQDVAIALQTRREIASQGLPSVSINGGYNYNRNSNSAGFSLLNQTNGLNVGVGISIPIFNGLLTQTQLDVTDIQLQSKQLQIDNIKRKVQQALTNAENDYNNALKLMQLEAQNILLAKENAQIALERFKRQTITSVELRQIQYATIESATRLLNAQYTAKSAELQLRLIAGKLQLN
ncbi:MAG: TolC family protein [Candidatus Kapabacteria bacterium]|nr:TolC family protein [Candidatus Kapabacteria bacterium]